MSKVAVIDCQVAGISGDMLVSALVDAGANEKRVRSAILRCPEFLKESSIDKLEFVKQSSHGFSGTRMEISCRDAVDERKGSEMSEALAACCDSLDLCSRAKAFALSSFQTILSAEANIHGEPVASVHLHEASSIDTVADIIGSAVALDDLGLFSAEVYSTRVAVGAGLLKFSHGVTPNPGPAILEIFKGRQFILEGGQAEAELCTPTGAALLANLANGSSTFYPAIKPERIGYGLGTRTFKGFANAVRVTIGAAVEELSRDSVIQIETNVDDISGEIIGNLIDSLVDAGAKDVTVTQAITKKNRPANLIRIISDQERMNAMLEILFSESGTLGARVQRVDRVVFPRTSLIIPVTIDGNTFNVNVKVVTGSDGNVRRAKPEFEDLRGIASKTKMPLRRVMEIANAQVAEKTGLA